MHIDWYFRPLNHASALTSFANHAESGLSIASFRAARRLDKVLDTLKKGDYVFIQFGHNDQKAGPAHLTEAGGYQDILRRFVADARAKQKEIVLEGKIAAVTGGSMAVPVPKRTVGGWLLSILWT